MSALKAYKVLDKHSYSFYPRPLAIDGLQLQDRRGLDRRMSEQQGREMAPIAVSTVWETRHDDGAIRPLP